MSQKPLLIGTIEFVSLPDDGIQAVPAKVDTGADNSSIWASNIHLEAGKLVFNFFAPGSAFYKPEPVISSAYRTTHVRNSFGHKEFRYKVQLRASIGDQTLRRWFTLADRSRNNYPILLGKNFLKNKFVVDVSQKNLVSKGSPSSKVLVLTAADSVKTFFDSVSKLSATPILYDCAGYGALWYYIDGAASYIRNIASNRDLADYSFTFFKNHHDRELAFAAAEYLHYHGRPFADHEFGSYMSGSKLSEYMKLSCYGLSVPATMCAKTPVLITKYDDIVNALGLPFVLKEFKSDKGQFNYLIKNQSDFKTILKSAPAEHIYLAQKYIPNDGFYRLCVMGKEMGLAIWRATAPHSDPLKTHLNKPRGGANAVIVPLSDVPGEAQDLAIRAADCLDRQIAGVDVVQDVNTGKWYVLEANNDPQISTGAFVAEKAAMVAKYFEAELNQ